MKFMEIKYNLLGVISRNKILCGALTVYGKLKRLVLQLVPGKIVTVYLEDLSCKPSGYDTHVSLSMTPHYKGISNKYIYEHFLKENGIMAGYPAHNSTNRFFYLYKTINRSNYLKGVHKLCHIIVYRQKGKLIIVDGLHRGSILLAKNVRQVKVKLINDFWFNILRYWLGCYKYEI